MKISHLNNHPGRYIVAADGPDTRSTWPECWGSTATHEARAVGSSDTLGEAILIADNYTGSVVIDRNTGRKVNRP